MHSSFSILGRTACQSTQNRRMKIRETCHICSPWPFFYFSPQLGKPGKLRLSHSFLCNHCHCKAPTWAFDQLWGYCIGYIGNYIGHSGKYIGYIGYYIGPAEDTTTTCGFRSDSMEAKEGAWKSSRATHDWFLKRKMLSSVPTIGYTNYT